MAQPQLREDAVLAADEQAGAPGRAAFGRHCDSALAAGATRKGIVAVPDPRDRVPSKPIVPSRPSELPGSSPTAVVAVCSAVDLE